MSIHEQKLELAKMILGTENVAVLKQVKAIFDREEVDFWDELSDYQKKSVEKGIEQANRGETISHAQAMKKYRKWL